MYLKKYGYVVPDFKILNVRTKKEYYLEHFGMMDDYEYAKNAIKKIECFQKNEIYPGEKLLITLEASDSPLNMIILEKMVNKYTSFLTSLQIYYKEHIYGRKKIKVKTKYVILYGTLVILFPVILTMLLGRINSKPENDNNIVLSGKYVILYDDTVTKKIDVEYFIPCVLMAQLPIDSPQELLKAQAVVIRTYIINKMGKKD